MPSKLETPKTLDYQKKTPIFILKIQKCSKPETERNHQFRCHLIQCETWSVYINGLQHVHVRCQIIPKRNLQLSVEKGLSAYSCTEGESRNGGFRGTAQIYLKSCSPQLKESSRKKSGHLPCTGQDSKCPVFLTGKQGMWHRLRNGTGQMCPIHLTRKPGTDLLKGQD